MAKQHLFSFMLVRRAEELESRCQRTLFWIWNAAALLASSAGVCVLSLLLAFGTYDYSIFYFYFGKPVLLLLNWLPVFLFQLLMLCLFGRQWLAFLVTSALFFAASIGNFFKLKYRFEPFVFSDLKILGTALAVSGKYDLRPGVRILIVLAFTVLCTLFLFLLTRGRPGKKTRILCSLAVLASVFPLWHFVYASDSVYNSSAVTDANTLSRWDQQVFISKGFVYPFLHSIKSGSAAPEGYHEEEAAALLSAYESAEIPEDRKVNLLVFQLESFADLEAAGLEGVSPQVYSTYHALEKEAYSGTLVVNVHGGGTHDTERCFLSGTFSLRDYTFRSYSHVRYLSSQGYYTCGGHPYKESFYSRRGVNASLGFEDYWFLEDYYSQFEDGESVWFPDRLFIPEVIDQFQAALSSGRPVFSFNVSTQGHAPYTEDRFLYDELYWPGEGVSDPARHVINNYLGSVKETQAYLLEAIERLRTDSSPVVLLLYGDHQPNLNGCGDVEFHSGSSAEDRFLDFYSTRYLIWANDAARELLGDDLTGQGPAVSVGFLMDLLFEKLGWAGSDFTQFSNAIRQILPVVAYDGTCFEGGHLAKDLSPQGQEAFRDLDYVTYYVNKNYSFASDKGK